MFFDFIAFASLLLFLFLFFTLFSLFFSSLYFTYFLISSPISSLIIHITLSRHTACSSPDRTSPIYILHTLSLHSPSHPLTCRTASQLAKTNQCWALVNSLAPVSGLECDIGLFPVSWFFQLFFVFLLLFLSFSAFACSAFADFRIQTYTAIPTSSPPPPSDTLHNARVIRDKSEHYLHSSCKSHIAYAMS